MKNNTFILVFLFAMACGSSPEIVTQPVVSKIASKEINAETRGPENGTLFIIGGGASNIFYSKFMELVGGADEPVIIVPTASSSKVFTAEDLGRFKSTMESKGFTKVSVLHTHDRKQAETDAFVAPLKKAKGIWFSGGRQWRLADSYLNTKTHDELWNLLKRGGVIAGSSAGATIQGSYLARGDTKANTIMMGDHEEGLGFITNVAIDQHLFKRNRQFDLFEILDNRPELLGIGLDEDTGIIVRGDRFTVFGESYVAMYDGTRWSAERDKIYDLPKGTRDFYVLKAGDEYDLKKRKVVLYEDRTFVKLDKTELKKYTGTYQMEERDLQLKIDVEENNLQISQLWNQSQYKIMAEAANKFVRENSNVVIEFKIGDQDAVSEFTTSTRNTKWVKVK